MPYRERLNCWAVIRLLPNLQRAVLARYRKRSDAEGYCQILRQLDPAADLVVIFDPTEPVDSMADSVGRYNVVT